MTTFGDYLKELRGKKSLREMERITGISHTYLSTLEKGYDPRSGKERKPTPEVIRQISETLDLNYFHLMKVAGYMNKGDIEELYEERKKLASSLRDHSMQSNVYTDILDSLKNQLKVLKEEVIQPISKEENELRLQKISNLEKEISNLEKKIRINFESTFPVRGEIDDLNDVIRTTLEYLDNKEVQNLLNGLSDISNDFIDLETLFNTAPNILIGGKALTDQEKEKALQILKLTFDRDTNKTE